MEKLKKCKDFGELYEVIGDETFCMVAKIILTLLCVAPVFCGVINFSMILDIQNYNAYDYNYKCMTIYNILFALSIMWSILYYLGKAKNNSISFRQCVAYLYKNNRWLLWWFALLIWTIIPIVFSANVLGAIVGKTFLGSGYINHIYMFGIMGCGSMIIVEKEVRDLLRNFIAVTNILAIFMIAFEYGVPFIGKFSAATGTSVYTNSNHYGYVIVLATMIDCGMFFSSLVGNCSLKEKIYYIGSFALNMFALMINDTLGAYLAIVVTYAIGILLWKVSRKKIGLEHFMPGLVILILTCLSFAGVIKNQLGGSTCNSLYIFFSDLFSVAHQSSGYEQAGSGRIALWLDTIDMIMQKPIVGYGPDIMMNSDGRQLMNTPHNEFLECAFYLGIPGLIMYLGGLVSLLVDKLKSIKKVSSYTLAIAIAAIGYLASSFFGVRKFNTTCYFFMMMGMLIVNEYKEEYTNLQEDGLETENLKKK